MKERTITKVTTETIIELNHSDLEQILKDRFGDDERTEWSFSSDFDNYGNVTTRVTKITTETKRE